ncbi:HAD family hydrolase [Sulfurimonas paralvinellae]|uniref:Haloacid dehalogenase n=1 Tax=Sulfurimonas paralvinellae TaxID=317658 RepID=A0A7M1B892_9BACT|nr:HAD hydrolase family protein [Sulfurimonas paralvinellae]QOP44962.1 haloacid dehalogenase [Sulfurimonas paralvinellae]
MQSNIIEIPNYKRINLKHIVLDYNGTIAKDGVLKEEIKELLVTLAQHYTLHVITADTFGSVNKELQDLDLHIKILRSQNHTLEKEDYIIELNESQCAAIGNGNNDAKMLQSAEIGICVIGDEGCSTKSLLASDIACRSISEALELFVYPKRLIATLRV